MNIEQELERLAQEYRSEGYAVVTHPDADHLPGFAAGFGVDMLATRGEERVLIQAKKDRADLKQDPRVPRLAEVTNQQPGWRYDVVVLGQDNPLRRISPMSGEPTVEQIGQMLGEAEKILLAASPRAAFVLAWAGLEAAMRRTAQRSGLDGRIGTQPTVLIRELYASGPISHDDFRRLEEARRLRAEIIHGLSPSGVDAAAVQSVIDMARRLLAESETMQPIAG